jgi:myo-inositol-1-phosphate synthase
MRTGVWLMGVRGSVATTSIVGALALRAGLTGPTGCVTELPELRGPALPAFTDLVVGGHDVAATPLTKRAEALAAAGVLPGRLVDALTDELAGVEEALRPAPVGGTQAERAAAVVHDLTDFRRRHGLDRVVVVNVSATEPAAVPHPAHLDPTALRDALAGPEEVLPASSLYAYAAFTAGCPYVDFTPSTGARLPALAALAAERGLPYAGNDGKTGETLVKSVLAPMFAMRHLAVRSWSGVNLLGGGDGATLEDPAHAGSKLESKARGLAALLGGDVTAPLHIDNVPDLGEQKTAWDHVSFEGFLGARMSLQLTWTGLDSSLAAPLVLDLTRLVAAAHAAGRVGALGALGFFFKDPLGGDEHRFAEQTRELYRWAGELA